LKEYLQHCVCGLQRNIPHRLAEQSSHHSAPPKILCKPVALLPLCWSRQNVSLWEPDIGANEVKLLQYNTDFVGGYLTSAT